MMQHAALDSIDWAASVLPHSPRIVQDAYDELLWAVLRGEHDQAQALREALLGLLNEVRRAPQA